MFKDLKLKQWYQQNKDPDAELVRILGIEYAHIRLQNEEDLYVTGPGLPFIENLRPDNFWTDREWFKANSMRLPGTSAPYRVRTKEVDGIQKEILIKWNRMGQEIPGAEDDEELMFAAFNSPFEEFALVLELRDSLHERPEDVFAQKPFAIYVPSEQIELADIGRKEYKMRHILNTHPEVALDMFRTYMVIYEWIPGIDITQALDKGLLKRPFLDLLTKDAAQRMKTQGFIVSDFKPQHIIVDPDRDDWSDEAPAQETDYAVVDFELLVRTPERDEIVRKKRREEYLKRQKDRFDIEIPKIYHPYLQHINILDVDYVYGHVESTKGRLWVLGRDPYLFDFFLPERWENIPKTKVSVFNNMFYTVTKDGIHLAWKISKVGLPPDMDPFKEDEKRILEYGYNSPFEEAAIAIALGKKGIPTIYPRAVYMSSNESQIDSGLLDHSRYDGHGRYVTQDERPILEKNRDYISIWGYWNGPDDKLANKDGDYYEGINLLKACRDNLIKEEEYFNLLLQTKTKLAEAGFEDLNLRGSHLLISLDSRKRIVTDARGLPEVRICNFEFLKKI